MFSGFDFQIDTQCFFNNFWTQSNSFNYVTGEKCIEFDQMDRPSSASTTATVSRPSTATSTVDSQNVFMQARVRLPDDRSVLWRLGSFINDVRFFWVIFDPPPPLIWFLPSIIRFFWGHFRKKLGKIRIIFDIKNWLWKSEIGFFRSLDLEQVLIWLNIFLLKKFYFSLN